MNEEGYMDMIWGLSHSLLIVWAWLEYSRGTEKLLTVLAITIACGFFAVVHLSRLYYDEY